MIVAIKSDLKTWITVIQLTKQNKEICIFSNLPILKGHHTITVGLSIITHHPIRNTVSYICVGIPVSTQRCFDVYLTSTTFIRRSIDVQLTFCANRDHTNPLSKVLSKLVSTIRPYAQSLMSIMEFKPSKHITLF